MSCVAAGIAGALDITAGEAAGAGLVAAIDGVGDGVSLGEGEGVLVRLLRGSVAGDAADAGLRMVTGAGVVRVAAGEGLAAGELAGALSAGAGAVLRTGTVGRSTGLSESVGP